MTRIKGPVFPSFLNQQAPKQRRSYLSHHSRRQQVRNLRKAVRPVIDSKDPAYLAAGLRVIKASREEPDPEFGALHLFYAGMKMSAETGQSWPVCMDYLMDRFDERKDSDGEEIPRITEDTQQTAGEEKSGLPAKGTSLVRRLLRAVIPRSFSQGNEADPT